MEKGKGAISGWLKVCCEGLGSRKSKCEFAGATYGNDDSGNWNFLTTVVAICMGVLSK